MHPQRSVSDTATHRIGERGMTMCLRRLKGLNILGPVGNTPTQLEVDGALF